MSQKHLPSMSPYPGLRPFSGDEAIYYCGRESHVEVICDLLRQNKFLMVAGASGDGKSSLVFAGLVPAMQAGFFKAQHSEFRVASFRPERSPMENFTSALATVLGESDRRALQARLQYGFSSLVEIAREKIASEEAGFNLVLYADQFEELFTYPENYRNGKCSAEAQLLVNLLLETSRIALEQNLPIYVVCTMRSDYIGQCSSFRGLAEYIGFSHYFVPRLNRLELRQVIEEPAMLNGDDIAPRLVERLLYDLEEGNDQLPVLQHALSRIWMLAGESGQAMDLMHYAKAGGMGVDELPEKDQEEFKVWLNGQPEELKPIFSRPGLGNVLNLHAESLLLEAKEVCRKNALPDEVPERTFRSLTQVDRGRVVRHQVSAEELLRVLEIEEMNHNLLDAITAVFRRPGNTFLRPFILENASVLQADSVLDITHESLIRNWDKLAEWTSAEEKDKQTFHDFDRQLNRWLENNQSSDYLLPIGPLNQFETWFAIKKPNAGWLAGLNEADGSQTEKISEARLKLENARQFIRKSARRLLLTRTVMKYGANRILLLAGSLVVAFSCLYYYLEYRYKQNDAVVQRLFEEGRDMMQNPKIKVKQKANFALLWERHYGKNSFIPLLDSLHDDTLSFDIGLEMFVKMHLFLGTTDPWLYSKNSIPNKEKLANGEKVSEICFRLLPFMKARLEKSSLPLKKYPGLAKRWSQLLILNQIMEFCSGKSQYRDEMMRINQILLDKYIIASVQDSLQKNQNPALFYDVFVQCLNLTQKKDQLSFLYRQLKGTDSSKAFRRLFPKENSLGFAMVIGQPRQGGNLILQFLAQRMQDRPLVKRMFEENLRSIPEEVPLFGSNNDFFKAYLFRTSLTFALQENQGSEFLRNYIKPYRDSSLQETYLRIPDLISNFRKKDLGISGLTFGFNNSTGFFFNKDQRKDAFRVLSDFFLASITPEKKPGNSLEMAEFHKARCIWYDAESERDKAVEEAAASFSFLKKLLPEEKSIIGNAGFKKRLNGLIEPESEFHYFTSESSYFPHRDSEFSPSWNKFMFSSSGFAEGNKSGSFRNFLYEWILKTAFIDDSSNFFQKKNQLGRILSQCRQYRSFSQSDTFQIYSSFYKLRKDDSLHYRFQQEHRLTSSLPFKKEIRELYLRISEKTDQEILTEFCCQLASAGYIEESLQFLGKLQYQSLVEATVGKIVSRMNLSGHYAEFMPVFLDLAFSKGKDKGEISGKLLSALSSTGGSRFIQLGFNKLRESRETSKDDRLYDFMSGLCEIKMLYKASLYIPEQSSSDYRMHLLNRILVEDPNIRLQSPEWKNLNFKYSSWD